MIQDTTLLYGIQAAGFFGWVWGFGVGFFLRCFAVLNMKEPF